MSARTKSILRKRGNRPSQKYRALGAELMKLMALGSVAGSGWQPLHCPFLGTQHSPASLIGMDSTNIGEMTDSWNNRISESTKSSLSTFLEINDFMVVFKQKNVLNNFYEIKFHKIRFSTCQTGQS